MTFGFEVKKILYFRKEIIIRQIRKFSFLVFLVVAYIFGWIISEQYFFRAFFTDKYSAGLFFLLLHFLIVIIFNWNLIKRIIRNEIPRSYYSLSGSFALFMVVTYLYGSTFLEEVYTDSSDYGHLSGSAFVLVLVFFNVIESIWRDI